jgi:hypothetical protein
MPIGSQSLEGGGLAVPELSSYNFRSNYSGVSDCGYGMISGYTWSSEYGYGLNDPESPFNKEYANLAIELGKKGADYSAWYSEYLVRNGASMEDYYKNYGEFEIDFSKQYYHATKEGSEILVDNGTWTYKGGVSFPLAFFLHAVTYDGTYSYPANVRDYGIMLLDGEEFRLTHTKSGKRDNVDYHEPCNIWCFKRK